MSIERILSPGCRSRSGSRSRIALATSMPEITRPKTPCFPLRCGVAIYVMKNCEPLVFGPEFSLASQEHEVVDGFWCLLRKQLYLYITFFSMHDGRVSLRGVDLHSWRTAVLIGHNSLLLVNYRLRYRNHGYVFHDIRLNILCRRSVARPLNLQSHIHAQNNTSKQVVRLL